MKREAILILAVATIGGCSMGGGVEVKKVAFMLPQGWTKAESEDKSVAAAVPPGFRQGANTIFGMGNPFAGNIANDPAAAQMTTDEKRALEQMSSSMSEMAKEDEMKNLDKLAKKGIILHCVSTGKPTPGEELTRFYVKKKSQNMNWTWLDSDASEQDCFKEKQKATEVKLPIGSAHRMQATWQLGDGASYTQISYLIPNGRDLFVLRFITVEPPEVITRNEKEVAESLRIN